ncbi:hypothetical protein P4N68_07815 [Corynebacterium felinum]|uniref:Uncharacterized protein n=1 Tax=Corynebacterium felinum TaxID=131318 RepID=A0ABU2B7Z1_9CORY|nr:hypothetical protein [Corynebacterium felinum]MDF5820984.1 hypothetical protein [Corynebacterium felinum]MDR7354729.1 hypothetical protein [Corynebacterium felinum]
MGFDENTTGIVSYPVLTPLDSAPFLLRFRLVIAVKDAHSCAAVINQRCGETTNGS